MSIKLTGMSPDNFSCFYANTAESSKSYKKINLAKSIISLQVLWVFPVKSSQSIGQRSFFLRILSFWLSIKLVMSAVSMQRQQFSQPNDMIDLKSSNISLQDLWVFPPSTPCLIFAALESSHSIGQRFLRTFGCLEPPQNVYKFWVVCYVCASLKSL